MLEGAYLRALFETIDKVESDEQNHRKSLGCLDHGKIRCDTASHTGNRR
jgi:hypothetical protein